MIADLESLELSSAMMQHAWPVLLGKATHCPTLLQLTHRFEAVMWGLTGEF